MVEELEFKNSRGQDLAACLYLAEMPSNSTDLVIFAHGFAGNQSESLRFRKQAESLVENGLNVLTFDFSGCGKSPDDTLSVAKQVDDLKAAIKFALGRAYKNLGLLGYSLGGLIALKAYSPVIKCLVLWAPVTDKVKYSWDQRYSAEQLAALSEYGYIRLEVQQRSRKLVLVDKQMLLERESVKQQELIKGLTAPILIIHGMADERIPYQDSTEAIKLLGENSLLLLQEGEDHGFTKDLDSIVAHSSKWFIQHLA